MVSWSHVMGIERSSVADKGGMWVLFGVLILAATVWGAPREVCYPPVGCFSMTSPWYSWLRPLPVPQPADVIGTRVALFDRERREGSEVTTRPHVDLTGHAFDASRRTFFLTHGFTHNGNETWLRDLKDALLDKINANVFVVDWGKGAGQLDYLLVASNTRVVAAEVIRVAKYLVDDLGADVAEWHLIGHSLGAHIMSYVAKAMPGIGRLTALDPAQPAFEHFDRRVRLDAEDAAFVDVVHTSARPFLPFAGLGMVAAHGHVDFYMNGGGEQPGCTWPTPKWRDLTAGVRVEELMEIVGCSHERSYEYFTEAIRGSCVFWGRRPESMARSAIPSLFTKRQGCDASSCLPFGLEAIAYPARGVFNVDTSAAAPFCVPDLDADKKMKRFHEQPIDDPVQNLEVTTIAPDNKESVYVTNSWFMVSSNQSLEQSHSQAKYVFRFRF